MDRSDFVIVGGVAAGPKTAATLARRLPGAKITLYQKETRLSYATCGMPFFASGEISGFDELTKTAFGVVRDEEFFHSSRGFDAVTGAEVISINRETKTVTVRMVETGETFEHGYGKLVLATGAEPNVPHFPVPVSPMVRHFTRPDDAMHFRSLAERGQVENVVIIGSGFIGCELVEAMCDMWGINTTLVEKEDHLLPYALDADMAAIVQRQMEKHDVKVITGAAVDRVELNNDGAPVVHVREHGEFPADYVFLCVGVHPSVALAKEAGLEIGKFGGIVVDEHMQTSDPDIYAGGDCVESTHRLTGRKLYLPMGSIANRHGRVIAENLAGFPAKFNGVLGAFVLRLFELNIGTVGLSADAAKVAELDMSEVWGSFTDKPDYFPESKSFVLKMVYENGTDRLLGMQAIGEGDINRRIDVFSSFLQREAVIDDLLDFEHSYAPPFSEALDPLHQMAGIAIAKKRGMNILGPGDRVTSEGNAVWIDVREKDEVAAAPLPPEYGNGKAVAIPLNEVVARIGELNPDDRIVVICKRGARSYQAAVLLKARKFVDVNILGGGLQALS